LGPIHIYREDEGIRRLNEGLKIRKKCPSNVSIFWSKRGGEGKEKWMVRNPTKTVRRFSGSLDQKEKGKRRKNGELEIFSRKRKVYK
jgi:hypothetical protein